MRSLLSRALTICAVFVAVWMLVTIYWRSISRMPTAIEIVVYLLIAPIALIAVVFLLRRVAVAVAGFATAAASSSAQPDAASSGNASPAGAVPQREQAWTLAIVAASVRTPIGATAADVLDALHADDIVFALDATLADAAGFPVRTGRVVGLDTADTTRALRQWLDSKPADVPNPLAIAEEWTEDYYRALAMAGEVVVELIDVLRSHPGFVAYRSADASQRATIALPSLQLLPIFPQRWSDSAKKTAAAWLMHRVTECGWPDDRLLPFPVAGGSSPAPLASIDRLSSQSHRQSIPCLCLVLACESHLSEACIAEWDAAGRLRHGKNKAAQIPGEGAAGLLITDTAQATWLDVDSVSSLHRIAAAPRDKSADAAGRVDGEFFSGLIQAAIENGAATADQITLLVADTDQRASRVEELLNAAYLILPTLDLDNQCVRVATGCGTAEAAALLTGLALAHHAAATDQATVLCVSNQDPLERSAVLVRPFTQSQKAIDHERAAVSSPTL